MQLTGLVFLSSALCALCVQDGTNYMSEKLYTTKTGYETGRSLMKNFLLNTGAGLNSSQISDGNLAPTDRCRPVQLTMLVRHGARYPSDSDSEEVAEFFNRFKQMDIADEYMPLKLWNSEEVFNVDKDKKLTSTGFKEQQMIGRRFVNHFPTLFETAVGKAGNMAVRSSKKQRARKSSEGFVTGVKDELSNLTLASVDVNDYKPEIDKLIRFYDDCERYVKTIDENDTALVEAAEFKGGDDIKSAAHAVSRRLSKSGDVNLLSPDDALLVWKICAFESSFYDNVSRWCDLLTAAETQPMEYFSDLESYYESSYGNKLSYEPACVLFKDMVEKLKTPNREPAVALYFGHSGSVTPIQAVLGLFRDDETLLSSNYRQLKERQFRTSIIGPFATNVALVLYQCEPGQQSSHPNWPQQLETSMVQVLINEHVVPFPFTQKWAASMGDFEANYDPFLNNCNFEQYCSYDPAPDNSGYGSKAGLHLIALTCFVISLVY